MWTRITIRRECFAVQAVEVPTILFEAGAWSNSMTCAIRWDRQANLRCQSVHGYEIFDSPELLGLSAPREIDDGLMETEFALQGLHCGACAWLIENAANQTAGWISARVKMNNHTVSLVYQKDKISLGQIARIVGQAWLSTGAVNQVG